MKFLAVILLSLALVLEASLTTLPLIFLVLLCLMVILRENWLFVLAFIFGLLFDLLSFKTLGVTSAFLVLFLFLVLLYQSKFEITTGYFMLIASFLGSLLFLFLQGYTRSIILESILSVIIGLLLFKIMQRLPRSSVASS
ncbi:MAG: rod shape-determining protein MreD [Candidatus Levyibacteriota bacterium]|jgi:cell shape-determining protein MreD